MTAKIVKINSTRKFVGLQYSNQQIDIPKVVKRTISKKLKGQEECMLPHRQKFQKVVSSHDGGAIL